MNKKGYIRTLEAVIAIVIILIFIYSVAPLPEIDEDKVPLIVKNAHNHILMEVLNQSLRKEILEAVICKSSCTLKDKDYTQMVIPSNKNKLNKLKSLITENTPPGYTHAFEICAKPVCILQSVSADNYAGKSVYADDTLLVDKNGGVRILRLWFWKK